MQRLGLAVLSDYIFKISLFVNDTIVLVVDDAINVANIDAVTDYALAQDASGLTSRALDSDMATWRRRQCHVRKFPFNLSDRDVVVVVVVVTDDFFHEAVMSHFTMFRPLLAYIRQRKITPNAKQPAR
jgi:uncharacterized protein (DUF2384 family)